MTSWFFFVEILKFSHPLSFRLFHVNKIHGVSSGELSRDDKTENNRVFFFFFKIMNRFKMIINVKSWWAGIKYGTVLH